MVMTAQPNKYPPGLTEAIHQRYENEGGAQLALDFGCPVAAVYELAKKLGIKSKSRWKNIAKTKTTNAEFHKTDQQRALERAILERYATEGVKQIATEFSVTEDKVAMLAFKLGVKSLNHRKHVAASFNENTNNCNADAFALPLSAEAAYFLGLLWADGSLRLRPPVHTINLTLSETEWHLLDSYHSFLGMTDRLRDVPVKLGQKRQRSVSVGNKRLVEQLDRLGIKQNKSNLDYPEPTCITDDIYHHWARGWLDGDGSISYGGKQNLKTPRVSWYGSRAGVFSLESKIAELTGARRKEPYICAKKVSDKCWGVGWSNWIDVKKIVLWLHQDGGTYAFRKHDRPLAQARDADLR